MQASNPLFNDTCADKGLPSGRPDNQIEGCKANSVVSRWAVVNGTVTGVEQLLLTGASLPNVCSQFQTGPIDMVGVGPDGAIYVTAGSGYDGFVPTDQGQLGTNPCAVAGSVWGGAFRSQDDNSLDGKMFRINPDTGATTIVAKG